MGGRGSALWETLLSLTGLRRPSATRMRVVRLAVRPARVMVFIDWQNLYHACKDHFGHGYCHPHLLAQEILHGRQLAGIRVYTGIHDPHIQPAYNASMQRRLAAMERHGVWTWTHPLKYSDVSFVDEKAPLCSHGRPVVHSRKQGREKGVDLRIGLDMIKLAQRNVYDVASLVTQDTALDQAVVDLLELRKGLGRSLYCENWFAYDPATKSKRPPVHLPSLWTWCRIDREMFDRIRDDTVY